jgi:hypothetical protein
MIRIITTNNPSPSFNKINKKKGRKGEREKIHGDVWQYNRSYYEDGDQRTDDCDGCTR